MWQREENLTLRVGPLPAEWEKRVDPKSGRMYFRNHETRETTWVDPRSKLVRKSDAADTSGEELPYGWDEAETNGETYYIDHISRSTSWLHPRLLLEQKRQEFVRLEAELDARAETHRTVIREYREKRKHLEDRRVERGDKAGIEEIDERIAAMDTVIETELAALQTLLNENQGLRTEIKNLNDRFRQRDYEAGVRGQDCAFFFFFPPNYPYAFFYFLQHGKGTFNADDVDDLYSLEKAADLPRQLDTMVGRKLRARLSVKYEMEDAPRLS